MKKVRLFLQGKKTYIVVAIGAVVFVSARLGLISIEAEFDIYKALGLTALATIGAKIDRETKAE